MVGMMGSGVGVRQNYTSVTLQGFTYHVFFPLV